MATFRKNQNAFLYRAGVRLAGTVVACDAAAGGDLVFLSHAAVLGARGRRALPHVGGSRRQILATEATLALLGPFGERLRAQTLVVPFGRPFVLGDLRLEIFPSGFMPGAASLLCERDGRRLVYAGPVGEIGWGGRARGRASCAPPMRSASTHASRRPRSCSPSAPPPRRRSVGSPATGRRAR